MSQAARPQPHGGLRRACERWDTFTPDGWYRTGDRFVRDADGYLYFRGRRRHDQDRWRQRVAAPVEAVLAQVSGCLPIWSAPMPSAAPSWAQPTAGDEVELDLDAVREQIAGAAVGVQGAARLVRMTPAEVPTLSSGKTDLPRLFVEQPAGDDA
ncbi:MAG: hypothetical protein U0W40_06320 [Acidimicrobiia bacterium]